MTDVISNLFVDVYLSKAKLTLFATGNCFLIASTVSAYSLQQMLIRVVADSSTRSSRNALYDHRSSQFDIAFHEICAETNPNMRYRFHVSWWNSDVSQFLAACLEHFVCHFGPYGLNGISNIISLCKLTIVIPRLPCLFKLAKAVSSTVALVNSVTSDSVNSFNFAISFCLQVFPHWACPIMWWMSKNLMANDTYDARAAGLLSSTV